MAVWASTPLPHKVSVLYTRDVPRHVRALTVSRRGIEALADEIRSLIEGRGR